jgi:hypothetical protein
MNFLIHFAKLYDRFKFLQIWQPTAVRHDGLKGNRHGPRRQGGRQRSGAGSGARGSLPPWATAVRAARLRPP